MIRPSGAGPSPGEAGSATVLVTVLLGLLVSVALFCVAVGGLVVGHRRAAAAADLAALAGADTLQDGGPACSAAATLAASNGARLVRCELDGERVTVRVAVDVGSGFGRTLTVTSRARAGPG